MFFSLLAVVFITLKLLGIIAWSWFWVLSPILVPVILGIIALVAAVLLERD